MSDKKTVRTLRLSKLLDMRVETVVARTGQTKHAFMLQAIEQRVNDCEAQHELVRDARQRFEQILKSGRALEWHEMRGHLLTTLAARAGCNVRLPTAADWARIAALRGKLPRSKLSASKLVRQMRDAGF